MWEHAFMFLIAFAVSAFGTVVGFGGGVFMVPILTLVFGIPLQIAIGSVILALFPAALISTLHNFRKGLVDFLVGILLEIPTIIGTIIGAWLTDFLPTWQLALLFSLLVIVTGFSMLRKKKPNSELQFSYFKTLNALRPRLIRHTPNGKYEMSGITITIFGLMSGTIAGLFGIGGGFLKGPLMVLGFGMPARVAAPTALFMIVITSAVGSISHYLLGHIQLKIGLFLVAAFTAGSLFGNQMTGVLPEKKLVKFIGWGLVAAGITMAIFAGSPGH
jgi:uncharacterized protein